jgi:hypothetical protein
VEEVDIINLVVRLAVNVSQQVHVRLAQAIIVAVVVEAVLVDKKYRNFIK